jgi:CubicO group peptidase (beta-lactamase class C family)
METIEETKMYRFSTTRIYKRLQAGIGLFLISALILTACANTNPGSPPTQNQSFATQADNFLSNEVNAHRFSGSVLVARDGEVLFSKGYSMADWTRQVPNTPHTKFRVASINKQFTAMAILILQEQGKLQVRDHLCTYNAHCPAAWQPITLHQLLTHTAGIPKLSNAPSPLPASPEGILALYKDVPLDFTPGTKYQYSNEGYQILGYVIQHVSGKPYATFIQQAILDPLHMTNTGFTLTSAQTDEASGYQAWQVKDEAIGLDTSIPPDMSFLFAAEFMYSTVEDLQLWDQALDNHTLVSQKSLDMMVAPYVSTCPSEGCPDPYITSDYGYGWNVSREKNLRLVTWHMGDEWGFVAFNGRYPENKVSIIVLSNLKSSNPWAIASTLEKMVFS